MATPSHGRMSGTFTLNMQTTDCCSIFQAHTPEQHARLHSNSEDIHIQVCRLHCTKGRIFIVVLHEIWHALHSSAGSYYTVGCGPSYLLLKQVLSSLGVILRSPCVSPICYANNDMFCITSSQDSKPFLWQGCTNKLVSLTSRLP